MHSVTAPELGQVRFSDKEGRFCITVPPEGAEYVHREIPQNHFLRGLLALVSAHGTTLDQAREYFHSCSGPVEERPMEGEFDLLMYFSDGHPDSYYYCLKQEGEHVLYHRFIREDYESFWIWQCCCIRTLKIALRWAGCPQALRFHTVCAVNAQTWRNGNSNFVYLLNKVLTSAPGYDRMEKNEFRSSSAG